MHGALSLVTAPAVEPVSVAEARLYGRTEEDGEDALLSSLIKAARRWVEGTCGRSLVNTTWDYSLDRFPREGCIVLPRSPLVSVTSLTYHDSDGSTSTVWASSNYQVDVLKEPGVLALKWGVTWPSDTLRLSSGVVVRFVAGYGATAASVPEDIRHAIKLLVNQMYTHREPEVTGTIVSRIGFAVDALLANYRTPGF